MAIVITRQEQNKHRKAKAVYDTSCAGVSIKGAATADEEAPRVGCIMATKAPEYF
jgi:hypothetical protein